MPKFTSYRKQCKYSIVEKILHILGKKDNDIYIHKSKVDVFKYKVKFLDGSEETVVGSSSEKEDGFLNIKRVSYDTKPYLLSDKTVAFDYEVEKTFGSIKTYEKEKIGEIPITIRFKRWDLSCDNIDFGKKYEDFN